jgi:UDP-2,3-diacylglucosamine pyrophosphatase LpxH
MQRWHHAGLFALAILLVPPTRADARRPVPTPLGANAAGRFVVPLSRATIRKHFKDSSGVAVNTALRKGRWKPSQRWLGTVGQKYGRLLIVSDMHPSTGKDKVTRKVNPAEDFKPNMQEVDFRKMMKGQWQEASRDKKTRTLVLNGDCFEFMQTTRTAVGGKFSGKRDRYGPLNTPENIISKLNAIYDGHPDLFRTYAEHLYRGHRIALVPGNHDRQMQHPTVYKALVKNLVRDVARMVVRDKGFLAGAGKHKRKKLAYKKAKQIVKERFELHPWFFVVGDVMARHGHETDKYNSFSTPFGSYYHPKSKGTPLEAALGDYIVKGVFNKVERRKPWTDNTSKHSEVAKAVIRASDYNPIKAVGFLRYLLTREGSARGKRAVAAAAARKEKDIRRYVREFGLLKKANAINADGKPMTEDQLVEGLLRYEASGAPAALSHFGRRHGALRRLGKLAMMIPAIFSDTKSSVREQRMADTVFRDFNVGTLVVGHDHTFRVEARLVVDKKKGTYKRATVLDSATWTDQLPEIKRDVGFTPNERRGVVVVDFDRKGSHSKLMNYDPVRGLQMVNVLESEKEAMSQ